ncbi:BspA family leucine-rich repeat surface protein [Flammeovirga sp. SubArs3]|uniref:BspA family leucine-rich repeat surface protein n=1 Tax=Flammeovirga sp. SubArs3 TaxID=2995316 RepID=UPI00248CC99A|nr:BspA family leucine-rich repeat surface protein [Flammeovirga sp. SubArs3]
MLNNTILNYKLTKEIGEGGMATVYLGIHEKLETPAAIKVLHKNFTKNEKVRQRFINEAKALYSLSHPYIVRLLNYEDDGEHLIMILEYIDGVDLKEYIQQHPEIKSVDNAIPFFAKVLEAFAYAHNKGLVHRDIKPSNIMVNKEGNPVVLDFGIAKLQDNMEASLTGTNALMGSRPYMSPEQIKSAKHLDQRSDIYSLGVTLYQLLTGENAYDTTTLSEYDVIMKIVNDPLPRASEKNTEVSVGIEKVIDKATAKKAENRFQNCDEFATSLINYKSLDVENIIDEATFVEEHNAQPNDLESTVVEENVSQETKTRKVTEEVSSSDVHNINKKSNSKLPFIAAGIVGILLITGILYYSFSDVDKTVKEQEPDLVEVLKSEKIEESQNVEIVEGIDDATQTSSSLNNANPSKTEEEPYTPPTDIDNNQNTNNEEVNFSSNNSSDETYKAGDKVEIDGNEYLVVDYLSLKKYVEDGKNLTYIITTYVTDMSYLFYGATSINGDISNWDVSNVTNMAGMFEGATDFNDDLSNWDVSNVESMYEMFNGAKSFNSDISHWDVGNVTNMSRMFAGAESFNSDISSWDVGNVTEMEYMFFQKYIKGMMVTSSGKSNTSYSFNGDISKWDVSNVTNMGGMFHGAHYFNSDLSNWDVSNVTNMNSMFEGAKSFNSDISHWDVNNVTNMNSMFEGADSFNKGFIKTWSQQPIKTKADITGTIKRVEKYAMKVIVTGFNDRIIKNAKIEFRNRLGITKYTRYTNDKGEIIFYEPEFSVSDFDGFSYKLTYEGKKFKDYIYISSDDRVLNVNKY